MRIDGHHFRTIWSEDGGTSVMVIDQTRLPFRFETLRLADMAAAAHAIRSMIVRGAPLIGATAAWGMALAMRADVSDAGLAAALAELGETRPTAVNLHWALARMGRILQPLPPSARFEAARIEAALICDEDVALCSAIGDVGLPLIAAASRQGRPVNILTHCNAGWLATVDWGTALAPIYKAHDAGIAVHVWVDETRPRNQGAALTAFELGAHGVPHTVIADNAGGHLMQHGLVDMVIVGTDRTTATGDVANKIGTYLKALAAHDNGVPFYVALPSPTVDWTLSDGVAQIPIEERAAHEVTHMSGLGADGRIATFQVTAPGSPAANPAFDVTPARLVTGLITERGVAPATRAGLANLFPDMATGAMNEHELRASIVETAQAMDRAGFCPSKSGNVSARHGIGLLITPSGLPYARMLPSDLIQLDMDGTVQSGAGTPSSEWPFHVAIYKARPDANAIVHTHSPRATALASTGQGLPAFHYMIALCGGADVRCADYATFGTPELAANAVRALEGRKAVLLANHGVIALGKTLAGAFTIISEVENLAGQYLDILASGLKPVILDEAEMARVSAKFAGYGKVG